MQPISIPRPGRRARATAVCSAILSAGVALLPAGAIADTASDRAAVTASLEASAAAWSRNDLGGFMDAYEDAPSTTYLKGPEVVHGFDAIKAMYAARFGSTPGAPAGSLGRLSMGLVDFRPLGPDYALCIGHFSLVSPSVHDAHGMFTLVFHRTPVGWKIVSDHTSS